MKRQSLRRDARRQILAHAGISRFLIAGVALVCASFQGPALAAIDPPIKQFNADMEALAARCELGSVEQRVTEMGYDLSNVRTTTGWTGGCVKGKRDGHGVLSWRYDSRDNRTNVVTLGSTSRADTTFVAGKEIGLSCTDLTVYIDGAVYANSNLGCSLAGFARGSDSFRKTGDGQWRELAIGDVVEPPISLAPGLLESASERMIADARADRPVAAVKLDEEVSALNDVVRDGRIVRVIDGQWLDLKSKRLAIVLTGHAMAELDRFRKMRQSLIDQSAHGKAMPSRSAFIENSDPARLLGGLTAPMRTKMKSVVPAEDLTPLTDGSADYVLVVDWSFTGNFALSRKEFESVPVCNDFGPTSQCATVFFAPKAHAWLFDRNVDVVRSFPVSGDYPITSVGVSDRSYEGLIEKLANGFELAFRVDVVGNMLVGVLYGEE